MLGYPCRDLLKPWCEEQSPTALELRKSVVNLTQDKKQEIVKKFYMPQTNRKKLAEVEGVSRESLYQCKHSYLGNDFPLHMSSKNPREHKELLLKEVEELQKQVHQLQLEKALLEGAAERLKKETGVNIILLTNQEKTRLIDALRNQFKLKELLNYKLIDKNYFIFMYSNDFNL